MAGDWLKFESSLPEKPETLALTVAMGWEDPDLTVGKLMRVFRWFDQHTVDGNAAGVTAALLDRLIGVTGFAESLANVGWLVINDAGLSLQNFERHNGASAKSRAQTAKRVATHRASDTSNAVGNATTVTKALAREEKRREEIKSKSIARGTRLPADWDPESMGREFALTVGIGGHVFQTEAAKFCDYWRSQPGQKGVKLDWPATWRNWCRNAKPATSKFGRIEITPAEAEQRAETEYEKTQARIRQQSDHSAEVERQRIARNAAKEAA